MSEKQNPVPALPHFHAYDPYYRANAKGTGSAIKFELHPAHDDTAGSIFVTLARQKTVGSQQNGAKIFPTFDWKEAILLKLDRADLSQILQVLRGMQESINGDKGLFHQGVRGRANIRFTHQIEPRPGYMLSVWKTYDTGEQRKGYYFFDVSEAFTLMLALERALLYVCFGIPEVIARPVSANRPAPMPRPSRDPVPDSVPREMQPAVPAPVESAEYDDAVAF